MVSNEPEVTAMQITAEEDFMIITSSGIFEKLQGIDLMNIIWQQSLMEA
jgi:serine/threonine protein phosphatase PrpC